MPAVSVLIDSTSPADPPWIRPRAVYLHVPFCAHKCGYCDFASLAGADHLADRYLDALARELSLALDGPREVHSIFIGGGTPTRLDATQLDRLLALVRRHFRPIDGAEWTVEANPGTLDEQKLDVLADGGVNRISLGAQSFQPSSLEALERKHRPEDVSRAVELIRPRFDRWSLDLIFAAPGSTLDQWQDDLEQAISLGPLHLSCYGLIFEKGTALWKQRHAGLVRAVDEEVEYAMYAHTIDRLTGAGLEQYEISNFARDGHESRHNLVYWANDAYYGFGLGAARYVGGARAVNTRDLPSYLRRLEAGLDPSGPVERLDAESRARETSVLMLRRTAIGIGRREFMDRTGYALDALCGSEIARSVSRGWLEDDGERVRLTRSGVFLADSVMSEML
ncbi:radical SAM family heme chaperone HemW [Tautonia plasticadhaerens]|uniref:Heme chaperone HemW n=1 Tax=Tautonia plasticadhaerens TaxID=2527974 RepID=A0A518GXZ9_9BACT|nr:radical SAM family heme chaperone HemW [Tautonia plasticadhaerens]QDV33478.1 Oxygen-independent coproporphyrinogen-III oxidase-like protein [Tautonia plasticadhaerens]